MNSVAWVYLPYFAFLGLAIAGLYWHKVWVVIVAVVFMAFYNVKPELEIICQEQFTIIAIVMVPPVQ